MPLAKPSILSYAVLFILRCCSNCRAHQSLCFPLSIPTLPCIVLHPASFYATTLIFTCLPRYPALNSAPALSLFSLLASVLPLSCPPTCSYSVICVLLFFFLPSLCFPITRPLSLSCPPLRLTYASPSPCPSCPLSRPICCPPPCPSRSYGPALSFVQASAYPQTMC